MNNASSGQGPEGERTPDAGGSIADAAAAEESFSQETTAESATLGPPDEENEVVATGPEPDSVQPGPDTPAETISTAPADPGARSADGGA